LLLIDEAHTLPSRLLEEVGRMLTNFVRNGQHGCGSWSLESPSGRTLCRSETDVV